MARIQVLINSERIETEKTAGKGCLVAGKLWW